MISVQLRNRALGVFWVAGFLLNIITMLLPTPRPTGATAVVALSVLATFWGVAMVLGAFDRWGQRYQHLAILGIGVLITLAYVSTQDPASDMRLFYVWVIPYAALFFGRPRAALHTAAGAALMAVALVTIGVGLRPGLTIWLTTVGLMVATGMLVSWAAAVARHTGSRLQHLADHDPLTGLANRRLFHRRLELTERVLMDPSTATGRELAALRAAGHSLLLDDFGTGYSALSYLADLPVDVVKVDRSFITVPGADPRRDALLEAVLRMTDALGLGRIAEGVESREQADRLAELGCQHAQGWLFGRPRSAADLEPVLTQRRQQIALHGVPAQLTRHDEV